MEKGHIVKCEQSGEQTEIRNNTEWSFSYILMHLDKMAEKILFCAKKWANITIFQAFDLSSHLHYVLWSHQECKYNK